MKITLIILILINLCFAQAEHKILSYKNFEKEVLNYSPVKNSKVSDKDFNYGLRIISEIKSATNNNIKNFTYADYLNVLSAFLTLKESDQNIKLAFRKLAESEGGIECLIDYKDLIINNKKFDPVKNIWLNELKKISKKSEDSKIEPNLKEYASQNNFDLKLIVLINRINKTDQLKRELNNSKLNSEQTRLDKINQTKIDSLYKVYKTYIGKSLVGNKYKDVMWAVIQHSNIKMMERYLPVIKKAYLNSEIAESPLKMLIDRYYAIKYGYQVFGSQTGLANKLADEKTRNKICREYGLN